MNFYLARDKSLLLLFASGCFDDAVDGEEAGAEDEDDQGRCEEGEGGVFEDDVLVIPEMAQFFLGSWISQICLNHGD